MKVQSFMEQVYRETGCSVFIPEQFIDESLGSETDILRVLKDLTEEGDLRGYATIRCAEGHDFFGGAPDLVAHHSGRECNKADCRTLGYSEQERSDEELQPRVVARYALTKRYRSCIEDQGQKKSPQNLQG